MKKYYYMASLNRVRSISNAGLTPQNDDSKHFANKEKNKISFSEGMVGVVALYANFQKCYDEVKTGKSENIPEEVKVAIQKSESLEEYLGGEGVFFLFDGTDIENEKNFMSGSTEESILPEDLSVCLLKNTDTNEVSYSRFDIIKYMMAKVPAESITYSGKDNLDTDKATANIQAVVKSYTKKHEKEINVYKYGNYTMETIPVREFCEQYLAQKTSNLTGRSIGESTMELLKDVEAVQMMENILDRDVRGIELERESAKEMDKIREKKDNQ